MSKGLEKQREAIIDFESRDSVSMTTVPAARNVVRQKPKAIYLTNKETFENVFGPEELGDIAKLIDIDNVSLSKAEIRGNPALLREVEIIISSWGLPVLDENFLETAPQLRAIFYAAGSVRPFTTPAFWKRNIAITSAYAANAVPVSEYTLGVILLSLKRFWSFTQSVKNETDPWADHNRAVPGSYQSMVGLVSCGMIGRRVIQLLKPFDVKCVAYDPFITKDEAAAMGVELCSLEELFQRSDVVSLHTPLMAETRGLITGKLIASMKSGATLINTSRGGLIDHTEMAAVLARRNDLTAVLDVFDPEPPMPGAPLIQLPNVIVTPHIAGSLGRECRRLGRCMVEELERYLSGKSLRWQITQEAAARLA
jgi:phosphoglycerate dehydrogenase-like enzyme